MEELFDNGQGTIYRLDSDSSWERADYRGKAAYFLDELAKIKAEELPAAEEHRYVDAVFGGLVRYSTEMGEHSNFNPEVAAEELRELSELKKEHSAYKDRKLREALGHE